MPGTADRYLYLARHGEATPDESGLTDRGGRQAVLLGERLRSAPLTRVWHGPLARARRTAELIGGRLDGAAAAGVGGGRGLRAPPARAGRAAG